MQIPAVQLQRGQFVDIATYCLRNSRLVILIRQYFEMADFPFIGKTLKG